MKNKQMMKKMLLFMLAIMFTSVVFGQARELLPERIINIGGSTYVVSGQTEKQKVAVWVDGKNTDINIVMEDQMINVINSSEKYIVLERNADFLRAIKNEQEYIESGNVADSQIVQFGRQFGAGLVCVVKVSQIANTNYVSARIINVETAQIMATANTYNDFKTIDAIIKSCEKLTTEIIEKEDFIKFKSMGMAIHKYDCSSGATWDDAKKLCESSTIGGYKDWRLPTKGELNAMFHNKEIIGNFNAIGRYWGSKCFDSTSNYYYFVNFNSGEWNYTLSSASYCVRCVRSLK